MTTVSAERLSKIFVEVADTLVDDFDLQDFLHMLTVRTAGLVGADTGMGRDCTELSAAASLHTGVTAGRPWMSRAGG